MQIIGIIPARYASSRFPGKPLVEINGKVMIHHVYEQCMKSKYLSKIIIATDDQRIYDAVISFGGEVYLTSTEHLNGTSRCAEVVQQLTTVPEFVLNIQGDEPLIHPNQIDLLIELFINDKQLDIATLIKKEYNIQLLHNQNIVKAISNNNGYISDFKRIINTNLIFFYKHIGIYGFKTKILQEIVKLPPSERELIQHLEQLRWLDNGYTIKGAITQEESISVDTPEDLKKVQEIIYRNKANVPL